MTPDEVYEKHRLNACNELGDICEGCLEPFPCDAFLLACWAEEHLKASADLVANLIEQRDALLDQTRR